MIQIRNLSKIFVSRNGIQTLALDDVSLDLPSVGLVFVVGKSGSGKSTLLGLIGGMDKPSSGEILLGGASLGEYSQNQLDEYRNGRVGFIFQEYHLLENLTARENVNLALWLQGKKGDTEEIKQLFASLDIEGQEEKLIHEMSGGQKQRVAIARSLIKNPDIILTDEPTGALDSSTGKEILKTLKQISKDKLVIVVSHDLENANEFADRIIELKDGKITSDKILKSHDPTNKKQIQTSETTPSTPEIPETNEATPQSTTQTPKAVASPRKKYSLPLTKAFKLGFRGMFEHKVRLVATLMLSAFALMFFGFFTSFVTYDRERVFALTMYGDNNYFLSLTRSAVFTDSDLKELSDSLPNHSFVEYYNLNSAVFDVSSCENYNSEPTSGLYQNNNFKNTLELDEDIAKSLNISMVAGTYPSTDNEVVVTEFVFSCFKQLGYKDYYSGETAKVEKFSDLIGKKIGSRDIYAKTGGFSVSGIVDTGFNYKKYEALAEDPRDLMGSWFGSSLDNALGGMIHRTLFVNKGFGERFYKSMNLINTKTYGYKSPYSSASFVGGGSLYAMSKLGSIPYTKLSHSAKDYTLGFPFGVVYKDDIARETLKRDEIIACFDDLLGLTTMDDRLVANVYNEKTEELVQKFAADNFELVKTELAQDFDDSSVETYVNYILSTSGENENKYQSGMTREYFERESRQIVAKELLDGSLPSLTIKTTYYDPHFESVSLAGVYFLEQSREYSFLKSTFISDELFCEYQLMYSDFNNYKIYVAMTGKLKEDIALLKMLDVYSSDNLTNNYNQQKATLYYYNDVIDGIYKSETILIKLTSVFIALAGVLALVAFVMIFNYFSSLALDESKKMGILRSLGAKKSDIFWVYYLRSLVMVILTAIVAIVGVLACIMIANSALDTKFKLAFTLLSFGWVQPLSVVALGLATTTLASIFPIAKIAYKSPIEAIQNMQGRAGE